MLQKVIIFTKRTSKGEIDLFYLDGRQWKTTILSRRAPESQKDPGETKGEASFPKGSRDQRNFGLYYLSQLVPEQLKKK